MTGVTLPPAGLLDRGVVEAAERTAAGAIADALRGGRGPRGVVVTAPAGAGKSHLVSTAVARARDRP
jgi:ATP/maltotriose-dependent transcriptional regulator MalT